MSLCQPLFSHKEGLSLEEGEEDEGHSISSFVSHSSSNLAFTGGIGYNGISVARKASD